MWSQFVIPGAAAALLLGCGARPAPSQDLSDHSPPPGAPDLTLHGVAFARLSDGRVAARGTAREVSYRRAGGRLDGRVAVASLYPEAGTGYAMFGEVLLTAPRVDGDLGNKRGSASGGVTFRAGGSGGLHRADDADGAPRAAHAAGRVGPPVARRDGGDRRPRSGRVRRRRAAPAAAAAQGAPARPR